MIPKHSDVPFDELRRFLNSLGFAESRQGRFWRFDHADGKTRLMYRPYRPEERVTQLDLERTRLDLDSLGILSESSFDECFRKATA